MHQLSRDYIGQVLLCSLKAVLELVIATQAISIDKRAKAIGMRGWKE